MFELPLSPSTASDSTKSIRYNSFQYQGPRLFNIIPRNLRDDLNSSMESWKKKLDHFLEFIPDLPVTSEADSGLCNPHNSQPTNSIAIWTPHVRREGIIVIPTNYDDI